MNERSETYELISKLAYLLGVNKSIFENEHLSPMMEWYDKLNQIKEARIVRSLCKIRTALMRNYKNVDVEMKFNLKNLESLPYFSTEDIKQLRAWGIEVIHVNYKTNKYIIDMNRLIQRYIEDCRNLFPMWLKWQYIRDIFIMPQGTSEGKVKSEWGVFTNNLDCYPYQVYMSWRADEKGNILYNDRKFVKLLYQKNNDVFYDNGKVMDAGESVKNNIYQFIDDSEKTVLIVDCENSDPYKLCSTLRSLNEDELQKIQKIILFDDVRTSSAWNLLNRFTTIKVEHEIIERVNKFKSLVDIRLTVGVCREYYENHVDSFIILSSDSDFWGLISAMPKTSFLVMIENEKCGSDIKEAFEEGGIYYCSLDDFCSGNVDDLKMLALRNELQDALDQMFNVNVDELVEEIYASCRIKLNDAEKKRFIDKYIRTLKLKFSADNILSLKLTM